MSNIIINKDSDFKDSVISSVPFGINNLKINTNDNNFDLKIDEINNNIKPMLSSGSNTITIPDGKRFKLKPNLNKRVPLNTFSMIANNKKNLSGGKSENEDSSKYSEDSNESVTDEILSNSKGPVISNTQSEYSDDDEDVTEGDYSSIESGIKNKGNTQYTEDEEYDEEDEDTIISKPTKKKSYEEIQQEKQKLLFNLDRLQKQGYPPSKRYSMASSIDDIQYEHDRLKKQRDVEKSIKFSRKMLMAFVSGVEWLNGRFDPFDVKLEGWSENMMENVNDYDEVFEELHEKYSDSVKMAPELKLISMVAGSGFMFHLTNSLFKSASPKLSDILKQNPDIMKNISEAAAKNMGNTINEQFGQNDFIGNMMKDGINMKMNQPQRQQQPQPFSFGNNGPSPQPKMNGPIGIDELLNELNDNESVSSSGSLNIKSSVKRTKNNGKKGGIQLDLR
jgi:hypothetical protein